MLDKEDRVCVTCEHWGVPGFMDLVVPETNNCKESKKRKITKREDSCVSWKKKVEVDIDWENF